MSSHDNLMTQRKHKFEKWRLVQGSFIYTFVVFFVIVAAAHNNMIGLAVCLVALAIYVFLVFYYYGKVRSFPKALKYALLGLICLPTSMIG
jgi:uncharacterized membrane protein YoaK (UPF0700 family)